MRFLLTRWLQQAGPRPDPRPRASALRSRAHKLTPPSLHFPSSPARLRSHDVTPRRIQPSRRWCTCHGQSARLWRALGIPLRRRSVTRRARRAGCFANPDKRHNMTTPRFTSKILLTSIALLAQPGGQLAALLLGLRGAHQGRRQHARHSTLLGHRPAAPLTFSALNRSCAHPSHDKQISGQSSPSQTSKVSSESVLTTSFALGRFLPASSAPRPIAASPLPSKLSRQPCAS